MINNSPSTSGDFIWRKIKYCPIFTYNRQKIYTHGKVTPSPSSASLPLLINIASPLPAVSQHPDWLGSCVPRNAASPELDQTHTLAHSLLSISRSCRGCCLTLRMMPLPLASGSILTCSCLQTEYCQFGASVKRTVFDFSGLLPAFFDIEHVMPPTLASLTVINALQRP